MLPTTSPSSHACRGDGRNDVALTNHRKVPRTLERTQTIQVAHTSGLVSCTTSQLANNYVTTRTKPTTRNQTFSTHLPTFSIFLEQSIILHRPRNHEGLSFVDTALSAACCGTFFDYRTSSGNQVSAIQRYPRFSQHHPTKEPFAPFSIADAATRTTASFHQAPRR